MNKETLELEIANAVSRYHREQQGKAPERIRASITGNLVVVLSNEVFTPNEERLNATDEGRRSVKSARRELRSLTRDSAHAAISAICGGVVLRSYWDLDVRVGEQVEVYVMGEDIEKKLG